ncbi:phospholipase [Mumia zhuanghuii]|uniref:Alpha/beta hydrolase n=2 Tax=Mumia TaxID=1546255 RepID=A0ABW1QIU0_9ACTN|nr:MULTISPECIES: phospholipase [Mumia]KAA1423561.1 phospholipase [Mumia zhuanghuii]
MTVSSFGAPVVATFGETSPDAPLVVLLHGRGSNEQDILALAPHLPGGVAYAAVRAPISEGGGYAWFANRGIGRPVAESLADTMAWFRAWLDDIAPAWRPVVVVGFSGGGAFAGGLVLDDPARFAGAAVLFATLPFEAGVLVEPSRLAHLPVFVAQGDQDQVIPRELLDRTWTYLHEASGAPVVGRRSPGGHGITAPILADLAGWVHERLTYVARQDVPVPGAPTHADWPTIDGGALPRRGGQSMGSRRPAALMPDSDGCAEPGRPTRQLLTSARSPRTVRPVPRSGAKAKGKLRIGRFPSSDV